MGHTSGLILAHSPKTLYIDCYGTLFYIFCITLSAKLTGFAAALRALKLKTPLFLCPYPVFPIHLGRAD
jgi:hypothetical protein